MLEEREGSTEWREADFYEADNGVCNLNPGAEEEEEEVINFGLNHAMFPTRGWKCP